MSNVTLRRFRAGGPKPLSWYPVAKSDGARSAAVVCEKGHEGTILDHAIDPDGSVHPSIVCAGYPEGFRYPGSPAEPCDWHVWAVLAGWAAG